jgi:hypothetical protein
MPLCPEISKNLPHAGVAQLVEQLIRNQQVEGSTPFSSSNNQKPIDFDVYGLLLIEKAKRANF